MDFVNIIYCRKYFKTRYEFIGTDQVNIDKFVTTQLQQHVQFDASNCGIYCIRYNKFVKLI